MNRKLGFAIAALFAVALTLGASRMRAQGVLTLEDLAEKLAELTSGHHEVLERLAALEAALASADWLAGIPIRDEDRCTPYESDDYRYPQALEAQIMAEMDGVFYSPYTGETFEWADEVDIEHIVARSEAHDSGLCAADIFTRLAFASDPLNLTFASPELNRDEKVAKDVAEWLPALNQCWFVNRVVAVKRRYGLSMDSREAEAALAVLESCSSVAMIYEAPPETGPAAAPAAQGLQDADSQAGVDALSLYDDNNNGRITCAEARAHGIAPVRTGHPAYEFMNDPDKDGVVCE